MHQRFTHDSISNKRRSGDHIDDLNDEIGQGRKSPWEFPPLEVFGVHGMQWSLSNRRLFIFRCLKKLECVDVCYVIVLPWTDPRLTRERFDRRLQRVAPKWERTDSTKNEGARVQTRSKYEDLQ